MPQLIISTGARVSENQQSAADNQKWPSLGNELTTFIDRILSKLLFQWVKIQFTIIFYLNNNGEVQLDLQHSEIFIFL